MTRKDELRELAENYLRRCGDLDEHGELYSCDIDDLVEVLEQVERDVWGKVIAGYNRYRESLIPKPGCEKFPIPLIQTFQDWLTNQQREME